MADKNVNLRDIVLTHDEAVELGRRGGLASGVARQRRKLMRETVDLILRGGVDDANLAQLLEAAGIPNDRQSAMVYALAIKAMQGDCEAFKLLRDTAGERPADQVSVVAKYGDAPITKMDLSQLTNEELAELAAHCESDAEDSAN